MAIRLRSAETHDITRDDKGDIRDEKRDAETHHLLVQTNERDDIQSMGGKNHHGMQ